MSKINRLVIYFFSFELFFALFILSGRFKGSEYLQWVPIDLTAFFFILSCIIMIFVFYKSTFEFSKQRLLFLSIFIVFIFYSVLSLFWSLSTDYALEKILHLGTLTLFAFVGSCFVISTNYFRYRKFIMLLLLFSLFISIQTIIFLFNSPNSSVEILGNNHINIGRILGMGAIVTLSILLFKQSNKKQRLVLWFLFLLQISPILYIGSRGPLISLLLVVALFALWKCFHRKRIKKSFIISSSFVLTSIIVILPFIDINFVNLQAVNRLFGIVSSFQSGDSGSASTRLDFYNHALIAWTNNIFVGNGIGSWPVLYGFGDVNYYPHNILLEILTELGLIGLVIFFIFISFPVLIRRKVRINKIAFSLFLFYLFNAMFTGDLNDNRLLFAFLGMSFRLYDPDDTK
ncbi:O-antigen ligase family protein [Bacillus sp. FJAT-44742]|uniref:O-antigen ligase family protein n=1 Tax=Bacillus sp. FJAT-44742 TaxID=2014005 RepID=UPI0012FF2758|nr:O-antigen ligase family protein [Bacillus sp. FJAT-44742]